MATVPKAFYHRYTRRHIFNMSSAICMQFNLQNLGVTVMILSFWTDMSGQTVQTQIREEQSDQGLHCLPFRLHRLDSLLYGRAK